MPFDSVLLADRIAELAAEVREANEHLARIAAAQERAAGGGSPGSERPREVEGSGFRR